MARPDELDEHGNPIDHEEPQAPVTPQPQQNSGADIARINAQYGGQGVEREDADKLERLRRQGTQANGESYDTYLKEIQAKQARRTAPTFSNGGTGGSADRNGDGRSDSGVAPARPTNTNPQFDDSSQRLIEDYALDRFHQRQNPDPNSGTALFEKYARELIDTLKQPVYSPEDEAVLKSKAVNTIEGERTQTKQRWLEELNRRGIAPSSGIALQGLLDIDNHFNTARNTFETSFAADAVSATRANRVQVLDTYGQLADSEESRLREAGTYAAMPYGLQNDAFQRNLQLVGLGGNPSNFINSLLGIQEAGMQADYYRSSNRAALSAGLLQYLGYVYGTR